MEIEKDILFVALTRPAMKWGVPFEGFMANVILSFFAGLWGDNPFFWLTCIVVHFPMRVLASLDHNFFRVLRLWALTKLNSGGGDWGGAMLSPVSDFVKKPSERSSSV